MPAITKTHSLTKEPLGMHDSSSHAHICSFYTSEDDFQDSLISFISQGFLSHAKVLYISDTPLSQTVQTSLQNILKKENRSLKEDQLSIIPFSQLDLYKSYFESETIWEKFILEYEQSRHQGFTSLYIVTEMDWLTHNIPSFYHLIEYEKLMDKLSSQENTPCVTLCHYNAHKFPSYLLNHIMDFHPQCLMGKKLYQNCFYNLPYVHFNEDQEAKILYKKMNHILKHNTYDDVITKLYNQAEEVREFSYMLAHDLKTHIRAAHLFNFMIQNEHQESLPLEVQEFLKKMSLSLHEANTRIESLNLLLQAAEPRENLERIYFDQIIPEIIQSFQETIYQLSGQITYIATPTPPLQANPHQITQLFNHLIDNCIKYRSKDSPLHIKIESQVLVDHKIKVTVTDNGQGFHNRYKKKIFQPFYRLHPEIQSGCGIGLSICQKIVQYYHGDIIADSQEGVGTTITLVFPLSSY